MFANIGGFAADKDARTHNNENVTSHLFTIVFFFKAHTCVLPLVSASHGVAHNALSHVDVVVGKGAPATAGLSELWGGNQSQQSSVLFLFLIFLVGSRDQILSLKLIGLVHMVKYGLLNGVGFNKLCFLRLLF